MKKSQHLRYIVCFAVTVGFASIASAQTWTLEHIRSIEGFQTPECAEALPEDGTVYVSNIFAVTRDAIHALDSNGYVSTLSPGGEVVERKTVQSTEDVSVHGASGMCFFKGYLYFNDRNGLKRCPLDDPSAVEVVPVPGTDHGFNDAGCDDQYVYVTGQDAIFRVNIEGEGGKFVDLKGVNGVKCCKGKMYAVTTDGEQSDLYELDPSGENPPAPFGLAPQFAGIDGIEVLGDGTFLITDCHGHKVYTIAPDRETVTLVAEGLEYPADLGVDHERGFVYIPQFFRNTVEVYRLKSEE